MRTAQSQHASAPLNSLQPVVPAVVRPPTVNTIAGRLSHPSTRGVAPFPEHRPLHDAGGRAQQRHGATDQPPRADDRPTIHANAECRIGAAVDAARRADARTQSQSSGPGVVRCIPFCIAGADTNGPPRRRVTTPRARPRRPPDSRCRTSSTAAPPPPDRWPRRSRRRCWGPVPRRPTRGRAPRPSAAPHRPWSVCEWGSRTGDALETEHWGERRTHLGALLSQNPNAGAYRPSPTNATPAIARDGPTNRRPIAEHPPPLSSFVTPPLLPPGVDVEERQFGQTEAGEPLRPRSSWERAAPMVQHPATMTHTNSRMQQLFGDPR